MTQPISAILSAFTDQMALFTDFDGTLVEIAPKPDAIIVPPNLAERLTALDRVLAGAFAIVTGRTIDVIDGFLAAPVLSVSGSHGAERRHGNERAGPAPGYAAQARDIAREVRRAMGEDTRILIETKPSGVAIHYRAAPEREGEAHAALEAALETFGAFHAIAGKKVVEARPVGIDKGAAIATLMQEPPFAGRTPIFIGDDITDEDGFARVQTLGGFGVKVGDGATHARFRLPDVASVHILIDAVIEQASPGLATVAKRGIAK